MLANLVKKIILYIFWFFIFNTSQNVKLYAKAKYSVTPKSNLALNVRNKTPLRLQNFKTKWKKMFQFHLSTVFQYWTSIYSF